MIEAVKDTIEVLGFQQQITGSTRQMRNQTDSLLDHIWSNCPERTINFFNEIRGSSDHNVIGIDFSLKEIKSGGHNIIKRSWKNFDESKCKTEFKNTDWSDILKVKNVDVATSMLEERIKKIIDRLAPIKTIQPRSHFKNWISQDTKNTMILRDMEREKAKITDSEENWTEYRRLRNCCTKMQKNDKSKYISEMYEKIESENDSEKLFQTTRNLLGWTKLGPPNEFHIDGTVIRGQREIADLQANYYSDKIKKIKSKLQNETGDPLFTLKRLFNRWKPSGGKPQFTLKSTTESEIEKIIRKIKVSHAFGTDYIDAYIIKLCAQTLIPLISHTINLSLCEGKFPARWKIARVLPLKKGKDVNPFTPSSYRPVSQLPVLSKIAERVVQSQLLLYLEKSDLLSPDHHAYRKYNNTTTALVQLMDAISEATDLNQITATMNIDLSAAFDCVPHGLLLRKLVFYGLDESTFKWISSYLSHRSSFIAIGSANSTIISTQHGVPQGSVLGPLLYLLFVNEMTGIVEDQECSNEIHNQNEKLFAPNCQNCGNLPIYADDGQFQTVSNCRNTNQEKIEKTFQRIKKFLNQNGLQINDGKTTLTEYMSYQKFTKTKGIPPELTVKIEKTDKNGHNRIQDELISDSGGGRMLGVNFKNNLLWDNHLLSGKKALIPAIRKQIGYISRISSNMSQKCRLKLVNCLIMSRITYGICIWGNSSETSLSRIQTIQNLAARLVTGMPKRTRQLDLLKECNWMKMSDLTEYFSLLQLWKTIRLNSPRYLARKLDIDMEQLITTTNPRLNLTNNSFRWKTVAAWNGLPEDLRMEDHLPRFKKTLKKWIRERHDIDMSGDQEDRQQDPG